MCGIAGYLNFDNNQPAELSIIKRMTDIIAHRGPDGEGHFIKNNLALGHRRLSIIDLNTGDQPMFNENKSIAIVFNGEIYNYIELREELKNLGHNFRTTSDTEIIIRAYEQWGTDCQTRFNGCWAFSLWDETRQQLFLSRDRIGEKPLFYAQYNGTFIFSSEIKSIFEYGLKKEFLLEFIELYLVFTNIPAPYTFYNKIFKLKPGHFILVRNGIINEHQYWDMPDIDEANMLNNRAKIYEQFEYLLSDSVKLRMRSDVSFGAFLSGGLDSSSVVSIMSEISNDQIETFTIGFKEKHFDESELAKQVSMKFNTKHHNYFIVPELFDESLKRAIHYFDEPFGDSSAIPTWYVSSFAKERVKMVLSGDGGDEVLSGYNSFQGIKITTLYKKFPGLLRYSFPNFMHFLGKPFTGRFKYLINRIEDVSATANLPFNQQMIQKAAYTDYYNIKKLTSPIVNSIRAEDYFDRFMAGCDYKDDFYKLMYINFKHNLPDDYLVKVDRMSMANSLEVRIPFLDHRLIEFMCKVDKNVKLQGWERKSILRNTIGKKLPNSLLNVPKKGFGIPLREWFKDKSFDSKLNSMKKDQFIFDKKVLDSIIDENKTGKKDNGNFIWSLYMLTEILKNTR
jgi:asparagine synthase (glutamine-hydrolysing)